MKAAKLTMGLLFGAAAMIACDSGGAEYVKKMEEMAEKTCACKDTDCTTKAAKEQADWLQANAEKASKLSADDAEKVAAATTKMGDCITKQATAAAGGG